MNVGPRGVLTVPPRTATRASKSVTLVPGTGGIFTIDVDGQQIWERKQDGGFPDAAELKRRVRDVCFPEKPLGHVDKGDQKG